MQVKQMLVNLVMLSDMLFVQHSLLNQMHPNNQLLTIDNCDISVGVA